STFSFITSMFPPHPRSTPFPYTTLFRSDRLGNVEVGHVHFDLLGNLRWLADDGQGAAHLLEDAAFRHADGFACQHDGDVHHHVLDRKSTRLNSSHRTISYAVFCLKKKTN